jgi:hypothetical protein
MNRKSIIGALVGLLLLTGIIGANLVMAQSTPDATPSVTNEQAGSPEADTDTLDCPAQGLPACAGQMNDDASEAPDSESDAPEGTESKSEASDAPESEGSDANESDTHEDPEGADHQCPPDCDTSNGEQP